MGSASTQVMLALVLGFFADAPPAFSSCNGCASTEEEDGPSPPLNCGVGQVRCGGGCVAQELVCGARCSPCPSPLNGVGRCSANACRVECDAGFHPCDDLCAPAEDYSRCGSGCVKCSAPSGGRPICRDATCSFECFPGLASDGFACRGLRLVAPLSTARATSRRPVLSWDFPRAGTGSMHVEFCRDRACTDVISAFDAFGSGAPPPADLPPGMLFWRASTSDPTPAVSAVWQLVIPPRSAQIDSSWGGVPDVNGDGLADVIVGSRDGEVFVYHGKRDGLAPDAPAASFRLQGRVDVDVASAGDVDGDGFADVAIAARTSNNGSAGVFFFGGGAQGLTQDLRPGFEGAAGGRGHLAGAGDIDGDGYADVVIAQTGSAAPVVVVRGGAEGATASPPLVLQPGSYRGEELAVAGVGDVNGDGFADIAVGTGRCSGQALIFLGRASPGPRPDIVIRDPGEPEGLALAPCAPFASSIAGAGDVDGDGYADIVVGAPAATGKGTAYLYLGGPSGTATEPALIVRGQDLYLDGDGGFGGLVAAGGDLDADGYADVLVAAPYARDPGAVVYAFMGGPGGFEQQVPGRLTQGIGDFILPSLIGGGDVDGDGHDDVVIGSFGQREAFVYWGTEIGVSSTVYDTIAAPADAGDGFGYSVADARDGAPGRIRGTDGR